MVSKLKGDYLDTPSLLLDLNKLEKNVSDLFAFSCENHVQLRPHIKTHKSVMITQKLIDKGATGITVAKVSEAEVMVKNGIDDLLIAFPISQSTKLLRVSKLLENNIRMILAIDSIEQANLIEVFFEDSSHLIEVWIKVDSGLKRCGVLPGEETLKLAQHVQSLEHLNLTGIFTHAGHAYAASSYSEVEVIGRNEAEAVVSSAILCEQHDIPIIHRSVGSTPTFRISGSVKGITEVRPGNAVFFDAIQVGLGVTTFDKCALTVLSSVVSAYPNDRLVLDAGSKTLNLDKGAHGNDTVEGFGKVIDHPELIIDRLSEEHGIAMINQETELKITDTVQIIPNHACTVVNLFDNYIVHRNGEIIGKWPIDARGKNQ